MFNAHYGVTDGQKYKNLNTSKSKEILNMCFKWYTVTVSAHFYRFVMEVSSRNHSKKKDYGEKCHKKVVQVLQLLRLRKINLCNVNKQCGTVLSGAIQLTFTCSKSTIETLEKHVIYVHS